MRPILALAALAFGSVQAASQAAVPARPMSPHEAVAAPATPASAPDSLLQRQVAERRAAGDTYLPSADLFTFGDRTIAAKTRVDGPVAVARGNLDVYGTIVGDAISVDGNVRVHKGARVTGDAFALAGSVIIDGGIVEGSKRAIPVAAPTLPILTGTHSEPLTTMQSVKLTAAWFALLTLIGIGVMVFAEGNLEGVVVALERSFARSFWLGLAGQLAFLPLMLVLIVGLAVTVLGVLLVPFAIVAYTVAAAGLVTLGFLAVARLSGGAAASDRGTTSARGVHLRSLIIGLVAYMGLWLLAALLAWNPVMGALFRGVATAITWVAATAGLGAVLASRAGTQRPGAGQKAKIATDELSWQTPTPVTGVAASTRRVRAATH